MRAYLLKLRLGRQSGGYARLAFPRDLGRHPLLSGVLQRTVEWRRIPVNPMRSIRKPSARPVRVVRPITPAAVEALRRHFVAAEGLRDATLVSVLAYAGLRPGEALGLTWRAVGNRTLVVKAKKTGQRRSVRLLGPVKSDLAAWRLASRRPDDRALVFPRPRGGPWNDNDWRNRRRRVFQPAARAVGLDRGARPYDLRHSFVSLLIRERASIVEVARQAGHAPTMILDTYGHVFDELEGAERGSAESEIRRASEEVGVRSVSAPQGEAEGEGADSALQSQALCRTRTGDPFLTITVRPFRPFAAVVAPSAVCPARALVSALHGYFDRG
jgi:integrase